MKMWEVEELLAAESRRSRLAYEQRRVLAYISAAAGGIELPNDFMKFYWENEEENELSDNAYCSQLQKKMNIIEKIKNGTGNF